MKSVKLLSTFLLLATGLSAGIVSVNLVDVYASDYSFTETDVTVDGGTGRKLYGWAESGGYIFSFDRLWIDISVLNGTPSPWVQLSWDFTLSRMPGATDDDPEFWFGVTDLDGNLLSLQDVHVGHEMSGEFYIPYQPEMNEAEVILNWWGTESFRIDIPENSIDFAPGAPNLSAVPEPATAGLVLLALGGLAVRYRRR